MPKRIRLLTAQEISEMGSVRMQGRGFPSPPFLVLTDNLFSFVSWGIKKHTRGRYNHAMWCHKPGFVATQGWFFHEESIMGYLMGKHRVKLWYDPNWTDEQRMRIIRSISDDLRQSKWKRRYDVLGIVGQYFNFRRLNNPRTYYCSERASKRLRLIDPIFNPDRYPSPAALDEMCNSSENLEVGGIYDPSLLL